MNRAEMGEIMKVLSVSYPAFGAKQTDEERKLMIALWTEFFKDDPLPVVAMAVKAFIAADLGGFPPHIGAIKEKIRLITQPPCLTEQDAWALALKAMKAADKTKAFTELPKEIQEGIGSAKVLKEWGMTDIEKLNTVISSNFMRSYRDARERAREMNALPAEIREAMKGLSVGVKQISNGGGNAQ